MTQFQVIKANKLLHKTNDFVLSRVSQWEL